MPTIAPPDPPPPQRKWTESDRKRVLRMLAKGASASVVAAKMGIGRNAAIGRIYRDKEMHLIRGLTYNKPTPLKAAAAIARKKRLASQPVSKPRPVSTLMSSPVDAKTPAGDILLADQGPYSMGALEPVPVKQALAHPMALIGTGNRWCKWPIKEDHHVVGWHLCCGRPVCRPLDVYCEEHRGKSGRPPRHAQ